VITVNAPLTNAGTSTAANLSFTSEDDQPILANQVFG
jgi:hypothetical protein